MLTRRQPRFWTRGAEKPRPATFGLVLRDDRGWNGTAPSGVVLHYRPGRKGEYAAEILTGFDGTIQVPSHACKHALPGKMDAYGGYTRLAKPVRKGGKPLQLAHRGRGAVARCRAL
jgi:transposase